MEKLENTIEFREELSRYIYLSGTTIVYETFFQKHFKGNFSLLTQCCADNIIGRCREEKIDFKEAIEDYNKSLILKEGGGAYEKSSGVS